MSAALFSYTHTHKNLKPAFRAKSPFSQAVCYLVSVQPCAGLNEKVYCTLACISTFSSKSAYCEPTMLLVFMNMETRRCHSWTVTLFNKTYMLADFFINFFLTLIEYNLIFLKQVSSFCINWYDKRSEFLNTAVPQCFRHSQVTPLCSDDLFYLCCCH